MILSNTIELINNSPDYTWITNIFTSIATIVVTMLTIYFTNKTTRTQIKAEIDNYKQTQLIDSNKVILEYAAKIIRLNDIKNKSESEKLIRNLIINVMAYGSKESIAILADFQQFNYMPSELKKGEDIYKTIAYPALLISQIKYETTGEIINPIDIIKININDIGKENIKENVIININKIVDDLNLNKKFKVKD